MESQLPPDQSSENEKPKEQLPVGYEQKKAFSEGWVNAATNLGYEVGENEQGKITLEKYGQKITLHHNFNASGNISGFASFEYPDVPLIKSSAITFSHETAIDDKAVKKTLESLAKKYNTRYINELEKYPEYKKFNNAISAIAQENGQIYTEQDTGLVTVESDVAVITFQHTTFKSEQQKFVTIVEKTIKESGVSTTSAIEWGGEQMDAAIAQLEREGATIPGEALINKSEVIESLKEHGFKDFGAAELVEDYVKQMNIPADPIEVNNTIKEGILTAELYKEAGYPHEALLTLEDVFGVADSLGKKEFLDRINTMMDELESMEAQENPEESQEMSEPQNIEDALPFLKTTPSSEHDEYAIGMKKFEILMMLEKSEEAAELFKSLEDKKPKEVEFTSEQIEEFDKVRGQIAEALGYKVVSNDGKYLALQKGDYIVELKHFMTSNPDFPDKGRVNDISIEKNGQYISSESGDQEEEKIREELIKYLN